MFQQVLQIQAWVEWGNGGMRDMFQVMFKVNECSRQDWKNQRLEARRTIMCFLHSSRHSEGKE